jgi:hypothetical protein
MTLPANIRVNTSVPFPSLVVGSGPVTVVKANGIWTLGFSISQLGQQSPLPANYPTDYLIFWDSIALTFFRMPISALTAALAGAGRPQRSITAAGNLPIVATDSILNLNAATDLAPIVPAAVGRAGFPLTFNNLAGSHVQTLTPTGADTFAGLATIPLAAGAVVTLVPYSDGVNVGYFIG